MSRRATVTLLVALAILAAGCGLLDASEITLQARNDSDLPMLVQVIDAAGDPSGPAHTVDPLEIRELELAVPGGDWTVTVNGARLVGSADVGPRRGPVPVTLLLPAPDAPVQGPIWRAPADWAASGG
jgi:hypothetical protein